ncbi:hypothetical protein WS83_14585 [Burkholderia sp. MSMB2042]|nr:hypothetical protein WS78_04810 [Burkholderia savannae]KVG40533.1 hypothetical protein WS77_18575 [Burkholderia sp. MSMB0265]KVG90260.1 hypothetical protein WS82_19245 [Burkholderia sp. MSMB2041]KVG91265.1 hypothetical protein WS83_14585 [Burkholderia sp. MSMB2042]
MIVAGLIERARSSALDRLRSIRCNRIEAHDHHHVNVLAGIRSPPPCRPYDPGAPSMHPRRAIAAACVSNVCDARRRKPAHAAPLSRRAAPLQ